MAKRKPRTHICSNCFNEYLEKEMYVVEKFVNRTDDKHGCYNTVYCKKCTKKATNYINIISKPVK